MVAPLGSLLERQGRDVEVERLVAPPGPRLKTTRAVPPPDQGSLDPEDVGVVLVVGVEGTPRHSAGIGLRARARAGPAGPRPGARRRWRSVPDRSGGRRTGSGRRGRPSARGKVAADPFVGDEEPPQQPPGLGRQPVRPPLAPLAKASTDPVGGEEELGVEAGEDAVMLDRQVAAEVGPEEPQPEPRDPRVGPVVGLEHGGQGRGLSTAPCRLVPPPSRAATYWPCPSATSRRAAARRHHLVVGHRPGPAERSS